MKYPWLQFFPGDWLKDPKLSFCSPATRGVWIDLICAMHEFDRSGELRGSHEQLARIARCHSVEIAQALTELQTTGAADVTERNGIVTVTNRRMKKEHISRSGSMLRMRKMRGCDDVTPPLRYISHKSYIRSQNGEEKPPAFSCAEIPSEVDAITQTATAGIPEPFTRYVYADWASRSGKDGAGNVVRWLPYVTKRWAREGVGWRAGTHRGKKSAGPVQIKSTPPPKLKGKELSAEEMKELGREWKKLKIT